jgi:hypothetical protein
MQTMTGPARTAAPPYTRQALVALSQGMRRQFMIDIVLIPVVMGVAVWLVTDVLMDVTGETSMIAFVFTLLAAPIVAASVATLRVHLRSPRCPGCGVKLATTGGRLQLDGDDCARCGTPIVGPDTGAPPALETQEAWLARYDVLVGPYSRWIWISGGLLVLSGAGIFGVENGWLPRSLEPVVIVLGLLFMVTGFMAWSRTTRWAIRRAGLNCPTCHDPLVGGPGGILTRHTLENGTCPWCHAPVWR